MDAVDRERCETHPRRGADYVRTTAGDAVAEAIAGHHERRDGSGFPQGLSATTSR